MMDPTIAQTICLLHNNDVPINDQKSNDIVGMCLIVLESTQFIQKSTLQIMVSQHLSSRCILFTPTTARADGIIT